MARKTTIAMLLCLIAITLTPMAFALEFPDFFNLQAVLRDPGTGDFVTGNKEVNVSFLNSSGSVVYSEVKTDSLTSYGVLNRDVGLTTPFSYILFKSGLSQVITIEGEALPEQNLSIVPYAVSSVYANESDYLGGYTAAQLLDDTDTNESTRFDALVGTDCTGDDKVTGVDANGNLVCGSDTDTDTDTTYTAGAGLVLTGTEFNHSDTSSQASSDNSGRTYIQDVVLDTFGHVTSLVTATETVVDTDTDTNESTRFDTLVGTDCTGDDKVTGVDANGNLVCGTDNDSGTDTYWNQSAVAPLLVNDTHYYLDSCADAEVLKYNATSGVWECEGDETGAGGSVTGTGTSGKITKWTGGSSIGDSIMTESGTDITVAGNLTATYLKGSLDCSNITNAASDLCTLTDTDTDTTYTAGAGLVLTGTEFNHSDTSSQASSDNSGRTYIQDIVLDTFGHITSIVTATETVVDTDTDTQLTEEQVQDFAWNIGGGTQTLITVTYQDGTDDVDFVVDNDLANYDNTNSAFLTSESDPNAVLSDGSRSLSANWDQGAFNLTNVNSWFLGKVDWSTIQNTPANLDTDSTDDIESGDAAGGDLTGTYPNPTLDASVVSDNEIDYATVTVNDFTNDAGYYNSEVNLTTALDDNYVDVAGDTMTGDLNLGGFDLQNIDVTCFNSACSVNQTWNGTCLIESTPTSTIKQGSAC